MPPREDVPDQLLEPPASIEAEQAVIGALLLRNAALDVIADQLDAGDFYSSAHRSMFAVITDTIQRGHPADVVTVISALDRSGELEAAGGSDYLRSIVANVPTSANVLHYARVVRERSVRRQMIALGSDLMGMGYARDGRSVDLLLDEVQKRTAALGESNLRVEPMRIRDFLPAVIEDIEARNLQDDPDRLPGMSTGLRDLDRKTLGMGAGEMWIVAGETSAGKTTLAMGFAIHTALVEKKAVAVFSFEMQGRALAERALANAGGVHKRALRTGKLDPDDWERVSRGMSKITDGADILIDPSRQGTLAHVRARCKQLKRKHDIRLVVIDYLQLMTGEGDTENERISYLSRGLKMLAGELGLPIIVLSQLNREFMKRANRRPQRSDLRGSGSLEQDADVICFVYRDELHHPDDEDLKGQAELILAKLREEAPGTVYATFIGQFNQFRDREQRQIRQAGSSVPPPRGGDNLT